MSQHRSYPKTWFIALIAVTPLGCYLSAAQEGVVYGASADPAAPLIADQNTPPATPLQEQPDVLNRGPVHEAFAEPVNVQLQTGLIAPSQPPQNIDELPPAERPQGDQFVWIPGYWSWDAERNSYIWVSACWRVAPPKMSWVPGYWSQVPGGWEWIAGYWSPSDVREVEYLPAPPAITDMEALEPAPSPDTLWVPPCMYWSRGQYVRRAGYWLPSQPNWVWVPSHYVATPRGYIFAEGHWDYSLERRGVLFAPVCFPAGFYRRPNFTYSPSVVIDVGLLRVSLFAYPRYSHYYFGDYYDDAYLRVGIFPWFDSRRNHAWYDPIYEHDRCQNHRSEPRWEELQRDDYNHRRADKTLRPARTYREQESRLAKLPEPQRRSLQVTQPVNVAAANRESPVKFERINSDTRQKISRQATAVSTFRDERNRRETTAENHPKTVQPVTEHKTGVTQPAERQETLQPNREHRNTVTQQAERQQTVQPIKEHRAVVTQPAERQEIAQPAKEYRNTVAQPTERSPAIIQRGGTVTAPTPQREPALIQSHEPKVSQPERVQVPVSPSVGKSGTQSVFQKGPLPRPTDESKEGKDKDGNDLHRNR